VSANHGEAATEKSTERAGGAERPGAQGRKRTWSRDGLELGRGVETVPRDEQRRAPALYEPNTYAYIAPDIAQSGPRVACPLYCAALSPPAICGPR